MGWATKYTLAAIPPALFFSLWKLGVFHIIILAAKEISRI
jgi:hypothetical protein